ncbi:MAG: hypothetical protein GX654_05955 [Desulfatiglans sp.]|nr:hypothetical protein [Desulfatiglans sp.]
MGSIIKKNNYGSNGESIIEAPSLLLPIQIGSGKVKIKVQANYFFKDDKGIYFWAPAPTLVIFEHDLPIPENVANISVSLTEVF